MKIAKLSLAAMLSIGVLNFAQANDLINAIKEVELSGAAEYNYEHLRPSKDESNRHEFKLNADFLAKWSDSFYGVLGLRYKSIDGSGGRADITNTTEPFELYQAYLGYHIAQTQLTLGKQVISSIFTDDIASTGAVLSSSDIPGITLVGFAFDALENAKTSRYVDGALWENLELLNNKYGNLFGAAAIANYDPVALSLWYGTATKALSVFAADLELSPSLSEEIGLMLHAQYARSMPKNRVKNLNLQIDDQNIVAGFGETDYYAVEAGVDMDGVAISGGYVGWKVKDGDNNGQKFARKGVISLEDQAGYIDLGEQLSGGVNDYTYLDGKGNFWFAKLGWDMSQEALVGFEYFDGKKKTLDGQNYASTRYQEGLIRFEYNFSENLSAGGYYSYMLSKADGSSKESSSKVKGELKYSF